MIARHCLSREIPGRVMGMLCQTIRAAAWEISSLHKKVFTSAASPNTVRSTAAAGSPTGCRDQSMMATNGFEDSAFIIFGLLFRVAQVLGCRLAFAIQVRGREQTMCRKC